MEHRQTHLCQNDIVLLQIKVQWKHGMEAVVFTYQQNSNNHSVLENRRFWRIPSQKINRGVFESKSNFGLTSLKGTRYHSRPSALLHTLRRVRRCLLAEKFLFSVYWALREWSQPSVRFSKVSNLTKKQDFDIGLKTCPKIWVGTKAPNMEKYFEHACLEAQSPEDVVATKQCRFEIAHKNYTKGSVFIHFVFNQKSKTEQTIYDALEGVNFCVCPHRQPTELVVRAESLMLCQYLSHESDSQCWALGAWCDHRK